MSKNKEEKKDMHKKTLKLVQEWCNTTPKFKPPYTELEQKIVKQMEKLGLDID